MMSRHRRRASTSSRMERRLARARLEVPELRVRFVCPLCAGPHAKADHAAVQLRAAREQALDAAQEAADALDQQREAELLTLVERIDARLGFDAGLERRLRVAAERSRPAAFTKR